GTGEVECSVVRGRSCAGQSSAGEGEGAWIGKRAAVRERAAIDSQDCGRSHSRRTGKRQRATTNDVQRAITGAVQIQRDGIRDIGVYGQAATESVNGCNVARSGSRCRRITRIQTATGGTGGACRAGPRRRGRGPAWRAA